LYFNSDLKEVARISDFDRGNANPAVQWSRLHIAPEVEARLGKVTTARDSMRPNSSLELLRTEQLAERPLRIEFVRAKGSEPLSAAWDEQAGRVTVQLASGRDSAASVAEAINGNGPVAGVVRAHLPAGSDGSGAVLPADSVTMPPHGAMVHTFNMLALAAIGQHTDCFDDPLLFGWSLQIWAFLLLFAGFVVKVPSVPVHTWLPDAHVEAPTPISMILAGILLKMGGYGIIRICYPMCPQGGYELAYFVCLVGVVSMVYGAFAAMAQKDFKRLVAYSSVSHMGYVVLGLGVWSARDFIYNSDYWNMGVQGAMFQMIAHGISSSGMFFMVGVIYDRVHHRNLDEFGGLFGKMPVYTALSIGIFFAGLGLPGLCGFIGEVFVVLSAFNYSKVLAIISAGVVILTAAYILWAIQRVYLGSEYKGPHGDHLTPSNARENTIAGIIFVAAILFGVLPYQLCLRYVEPTVERQVEELAAWSKRFEFEKERPGSGEGDRPAAAAAGAEPSTVVSAVPGTLRVPR
jgi:NADH-quinone oxidoreductase subunit M